MKNVLIETQDGSHSLMSGAFGVSYHSRYGAIQESLHVFIKAGLHWKALKSKQIRILEIGFGTGLNAYLTMLEAARLGLDIYYETIEAYPISREEASTLNYPQLLKPEESSTLFMGLHQAPFEEKAVITRCFQFLKREIKFGDIQYENEFDLIFFDAFAPDVQPELWEQPMLQKVYEALKKDGIMVTYCAKGYVKRNLKAVGFQVEALPGPPGKREMTRGIKQD